MCLQIWMQNIDHPRSHGTQYERMLGEYAELVSAARTRLSRDPRLCVDGLDDLHQQLSLLSVKHLIMHLCILLQLHWRFMITLFLNFCLHFVFAIIGCIQKFIMS